MTSADAGAKGDKAALSATYELYYQPDAAVAGGGVGPGAADAAASEAARFRSLEQRVAGLEGWLGEGRSGHGAVAAPDADTTGDAGSAGAGLYGTMRGLTGAGGEGGGVAALPLVDAVAVLEERLARLDRPQVEGCAGALRSLRKELDAFNSDQARAGGPGGSAETEQLSALLRRTELIDDYGADLPALVARLRTLQALHTQVSGWGVCCCDFRCLPMSTTRLSSLPKPPSPGHPLGQPPHPGRAGPGAHRPHHQERPKDGGATRDVAEEQHESAQGQHQGRGPARQRAL